ncbi:MAG: DUF4274 domain-containing protein [Oxalobacteraceae bacterium]|nr:MAG: DUF4274 domain-containing protein [Oxalobacteraceae bacterium]
MVEPVFSNAVRRAIADVAHGNRPARFLDDPVALHQAALTWNGDSTEPADLLALAAHPKLARGTLLMLYWRAAPSYYRRYATAAEVPDCEREDYQTCQALAELNLSRTDLADGIAFDPRDDDGYDWTTAYDGDDDQPRRSGFPFPQLLVPVPGDTVAWPTGPDQLTRPPDPAEQAVIAAGIKRGWALLPALPADAAPRAVAEAVAEALRHAGPATPADLAWPWLDALGWDWRCGDSATDGVVFGVARDDLSCFVPDIVSRTAEAGIDPAETLRFFDLVQRMPPGLPDDAFWTGSDVAFAAGWLG